MRRETRSTEVANFRPAAHLVAAIVAVLGLVAPTWAAPVVVDDFSG